MTSMPAESVTKPVESIQQDNLSPASQKDAGDALARLVDHTSSQEDLSDGIHASAHSKSILSYWYQYVFSNRSLISLRHRSYPIFEKIVTWNWEPRKQIPHRQFRRGTWHWWENLRDNAYLRKVNGRNRWYHDDRITYEPKGLECICFSGDGHKSKFWRIVKPSKKFCVNSLSRCVKLLESIQFKSWYTILWLASLSDIL